MGYGSDSKYKGLSFEQRKILKSYELIKVRKLLDGLPEGVSLRSVLSGSGIRNSNVSAFLAGNLETLSLDSIDRLKEILKEPKTAERSEREDDGLPYPRLHMWIGKRARALVGTKSMALAPLAVAAATCTGDDMELAATVFLHMVMKKRVHAYEKLWRDPKWGGVFEDALEIIDPALIEKQAVMGVLPQGLPDCITDILERYRTATQAKELREAKRNELARFVDTMAKNHDLTTGDIAELTGRPRRTIARFLRFARPTVSQWDECPFSPDTMAQIARAVQAKYMAEGDPALPDISKRALHPELA